MTSFWQDETGEEETYDLSIQGVALAPDTEGEYRLVLRTSRGDIPGQFTVCEGETGAAVMALQKYKYTDILKHYYSDIAVQNVYGAAEP